MLKAYVRRHDGTTQAVGVPHTGQHLSQVDGRVRVARLHWERQEPKDAAEAAGYELLNQSVALLDTLILARMASNGERAVFHGLMTVVDTDPTMISVMAVDDPRVERLYDQAWWNNAPLHASDQPEPQQAAGPQPPAQDQGAQATMAFPAPQTLGGVPLAQASEHQASHPMTPDPAARPGGRPAAPPAGPWSALPQRATADA